MTPCSGAPGTGFHPEPAHKGQTSTAVFISIIQSVIKYESKNYVINFAPNLPFPQPESVALLCTSCGDQRRIVQNRQIRRESDSRKILATAVAILHFAHLASISRPVGVKSSNWHVFAIDNPVV
jgi:hypothetical protein